MIMMRAGIFLVRVPGVEGRAFVHVGLPIPASCAVYIRRSIPVEGVARIKHGHTVNEIANGSEAREVCGCVDCGRQRDAIEHVLVLWEIGEAAVLPWPHGVAGEAGG